MAKEKHALLSASSSHKWLHCTPSARLEESLPDDTSEAAKMGTLAHALCELKLQKIFTDRNMSTKSYNSKLKKITSDELYDTDMDRNSDTYVDIIKEIAFAFPSTPLVAIEKKVDYSNWVPEGFGTSDCILIRGNEMHVVDYKNGTGVAVSAIDNPQMKLYALGAMQAYGYIFPIEKITLHIVQPNRSIHSEWTLSKDELLFWGDTYVRPISKIAFDGKGDFIQGEWCDSNFCRAKAICRKRMDENMSLMENAVDAVTQEVQLPPLISDEEVGKLLKKAQFLASWVKRLEGYALDKIVSGGVIPGWKIVEGRSNRTITDFDIVVDKLKEAGYEEAILYEKKPIALTALEKIIEKEDFKNCVQSLITKPPGKPTLAPEDDKRTAMQVRPTTEDAFGGNNTYKED